MTPAARLAAAIDLATAVEESLSRHGPAADVLVQRYFRERRYAGSGDRAAVRDLLYRTLRRRGELVWRLRHVDGPTDGRSLVLLAMALEGGLAPALFEGPHAVPAPGEDEAAMFARAVDAGTPPPWARLNMPQWLHDALAARFGDALEAEMAAMAGRAPMDLRVNRARTDRETVLEALAQAGIAAAPTPWSPLGIRIADPVDLSRFPLLLEGRVEVQDESAQIASLLTGAAPGMQVADLCAGAGGKTLALSDMMANRGQIFAFDTDKRRLDELKTRADRSRVRNVQIHRLTGGEEKRRDQLGRFAGKMDLVIVDAPCSGSGTWRRNPELRWRLAPEDLARLVERQHALLGEAFDLVRPGGRVAWMTCSMLAAENEEPVAAALDAGSDRVLLDVGEALEAAGLGALPRGPVPGRGMLQLSPAVHGTDGFFVALMAKSEGE